MTNDEKYIIIVGGQRSDKIHVLDLDKSVLTESWWIRCPESGPNLVVKEDQKMTTDLLVHGYIKTELYYHDMIYIPLDIMNMISRYYGFEEMIHWIYYSKSNTLYGQNQRKDHFTIPINDILNDETNFVKNKKGSSISFVIRGGEAHLNDFWKAF